MCSTFCEKMNRAALFLALIVSCLTCSCSETSGDGETEDKAMELSHDVSRNADFVITHSPDPGFFYLADPDSYDGFIGENHEIEEFYKRISEQMRLERIATWGTPEKDDLKIRMIVRQHYDLDPPSSDYSAVTAFYVRTGGNLCFGSDRDVGMCAMFADARLDDEPSTHPTYARHLLKVPAGRYRIEVYRHFGWYEGAQDAPLLNDGVNYTVVISRHHTGNRIPHFDIPWTTMPTPPLSPDEIQ